MDPLSAVAASSSSGGMFPFTGLPVSPLTKDSTGLTGKRKCFQDACYALESKSEDENEFGLDGQVGLGEEDFGGSPAPASTSTSKVSTSKASPTNSPDLMECPKRECSKMFKDLHAIKFHLSHAHNELEEAHNKRMKERELQKKREREEEEREEEERRKVAAIKKEAATVKTEMKQEVGAVAAVSAAVSMVKKEENGHIEEARRHLEQAVNLVRSNGSLPTAAPVLAPVAPLAHGASHLPHHNHPHPQQRTAIVRPILNSPPPAKLPPIGPPPHNASAMAAASLRHPGPPNPLQGLPPPPPAHMSFNGMANKATAKPLPAPAQPPPPAKPAVKAAPSPTYSDISDEETEAPSNAGGSSAPMRPSLPPAQQGLVIPRVPPQATSKPIIGNVRAGGPAPSTALGSRPSAQSIGPPPPGFPHSHLGLGGGSGGQPPPPHLLGSPFNYLSSGVPPPPAHGASPSSVPQAAHMASMVNAMMSAGMQPSPGISAARPMPGASSAAAPRPQPPPSPAMQMQEMMNAANKYLASTKLQELQEKAQQGGAGGNKAPSAAAAAFPYGANPAAAMAAAAALLAPPPPSASSPMSMAQRQSSSPLAPPKPGAPNPARPPPAHFGGTHHPQPPHTSAAAAVANPFGLVHPSLGSVAASLPFQSEYTIDGGRGV